MKRLIFVIFLLACLSACKKEHVEPLSTSEEVNKLPQKVVTTTTCEVCPTTTTIQHYTYNTQGLVIKVWIYDSLTPEHQDSILYTYDSNNRLSSKIYYFDNYGAPTSFVRPQIYNYNNYGMIETFQDYDTIYTYQYKLGGEVDYIIRSNATSTFQDSIKMYPGSAVSYLGKGEGTLGATDDYRSIKTEYFFNTENGIYQDRGIWVYYNPVWGSQYANRTVCIDKEVEFQNEVAYTIVPIGQAGYFNMYTRTTPYKYATYAKHLISPLLNTEDYEASYTFDIDGRLTFVEAQHGRIDPIAIDGIVPAVIYFLNFTTTIYY